MQKIEIISETVILYGGRALMLDEYHVYLDARLRSRTELCSPYFFSGLQELLDSGALEKGTGTGPVTVFIAPSVYWLAPPGDMREVHASEGERLPYEKKVQCGSLILEGLCGDAADVVFAADKGQSHGCVGNYTMFHFKADSLYFKNLTVGNYCNVDLIYPSDPTENRRKRTQAITQAQLGDVDGDRFFAENCRFISRLNLYPLCGAERSLYKDCHFECTDDSLNGNAVYLNCDFDFYGKMPLSHTDFTGCVFLACVFRIKSAYTEGGPDQYFMKNAGSIALIDCKFECGRENIAVRWSGHPAGNMKCYEYHSTFNGKKFVTGIAGQETVELDGLKALSAYCCRDGKMRYNVRNLLCGRDGWDPLEQGGQNEPLPTMMTLSAGQAVLESGHDSLTVSAGVYYFHGEKKPTEEVFFRAESMDEASLTIRKKGRNCCEIKGRNTGKRDSRLLLTAYTEDGLQAALPVIVKPALTAAPVFLKKPELRYERERFVLAYELALEGYEDCSDIRWYRRMGEEESLLAVSREGVPNISYQPVDADIGCKLAVRMIPRTNCSASGGLCLLETERAISRRDIPFPSRVWTDFSAFPTSLQHDILPGRWIVDFYEPPDRSQLCEWRKWVKTLPENAWAYGALGNGCRGKGLYPLTQGTRLFYVFGKKCDSMRVCVIADPAKTAGQGFGSAGQYMDVCVKFDVADMNGYALRVMRTKEASDAVAMFLVRYVRGIAAPISESILTSCFITGCRIEVEAAGKSLRAKAFTESRIPPDKSWKKEVFLQSEIEESPEAGFGVLHTGTNGDGGWQNTVMLHEIEAFVTDL